MHGQIYIKSIPTCTHCSMLKEPIRLPVKQVPLATDQAQGKACIDQITSFKKTNTIDLHKHIRIAKYGCLHKASRLPKLYRLFVHAILNHRWFIGIWRNVNVPSRETTRETFPTTWWWTFLVRSSNTSPKTESFSHQTSLLEDKTFRLWNPKDFNVKSKDFNV